MKEPAHAACRTRKMKKITPHTPVCELTGIGKTRTEKLHGMGIFTADDLIHLFPRAYERRGDVCLLREGDPANCRSYVLTTATQPHSALIRRGFTLTKFRAHDESGSAQIVFFNAPFVRNIFEVGTVFRFYGKIIFQKGGAQLINPKYEPVLPGVPLPDFLPVYPLTQGITQKMLSGWIREVLNDTAKNLPDPLPESLRLERGLCTYSYAVCNAHFPQDEEALTRALRRLSYSEMLCFGLGVARSACRRRDTAGIAIPPCSVKPLLTLLPYTLTDSQKTAIREIYRDMTAAQSTAGAPPMARILIGDVGSGKTVCAAAAAYIALHGGCQCALLAPTEILARQHFAQLSPLFEKLGFRTQLLIGACTPKEKERIRAAVADGEVSLLIGTHALFSEPVHFRSLGLIVADEQHRFGVAQRAALKRRAPDAHLLVMSATPIPRSLALAMYADLDVSQIRQMPAGRTPVRTYAVDESYRERLYAFMRRLVSEGGQCYAVCPAIEPQQQEGPTVFPGGLSEKDLCAVDAEKTKNVIDYTVQLRQALPGIRIESLHGKMKSSQKEEIMQRFVGGETDILVSTTVIEVGINVPNACLMLIENAERFGLAQLHQLRGRVGRGTRKSYCVLVRGGGAESAQERLRVLTETTDGFRIAQQDLKLRGPGDFFAAAGEDTVRQSGGFSFRFAQLCNDNALFDAAFADARALLADDPSLEKPEHAALAQALERMMHVDPTEIS